MSAKENYGDATHVRRKRAWVEFQALTNTSCVTLVSHPTHPCLRLKKWSFWVLVRCGPNTLLRMFHTVPGASWSLSVCSVIATMVQFGHGVQPLPGTCHLHLPLPTMPPHILRSNESIIQ